MISESHTLPFSVDNISAWLQDAEQDYAIHVGARIHKRLAVAVGRQEFIVYDHGKEIYRGMQAISAIEAYNNIQR